MKLWSLEIKCFISRGGPSLVDVQHRKIWSLSTGKGIHECDVDDVSDEELNRKLPAKDNIRVEITLKNALTLERKGPDVAEIFLPPRVCQEIGSKKINGESFRPGCSLDLTSKDPKTGRHWDLSIPDVQNRLRQLIRPTQP